MTELVTVKKDDVFTDSMIIANGTGNRHSSIQQRISKYEKPLSELGRVFFENRPLETRGGVQNVKIYFLNEQQATFFDNVVTKYRYCH